MFNLIKLYNTYIYRDSYVSYRYTTPKLNKVLFHFKWMRLNFKLNKLNPTRVLAGLKILMRFLLMKKKQKKFKKYSFFKYSIYSYRRLVKVRFWLKINQFLTKKYNLPFYKNAIVLKRNNTFINTDDDLALEVRNGTGILNLYTLLQKRKWKFVWEIRRKYTFFKYSRVVETGYRTHDLDAIDYYFEKNKYTLRLLLKRNFFKKKKLYKKSKKSIYRLQFLKKPNYMLVCPSSNSTLSNYHYGDINVMYTPKVIALKVLLNTYNKKTINWRITT